MNPSFFPPILYFPPTVIPNPRRKTILLRSLLSGIFFFLARQLYLSSTPTPTIDLHHSFELELDHHLIKAYSTVFQDLIQDGFLTVNSKTLAIGIHFLEFTSAFQENGVLNAKSTKKNVFLPYGNSSFNFIFSSHTGLDCSINPYRFTLELSRTLKPEGYLVIHTESKNLYSLNSLLNLFDSSFKLIRSREVVVQHWSVQGIREIVLKKQDFVQYGNGMVRRRRRNVLGSCPVPKYKKKLIQEAEGLVFEEPLMFEDSKALLKKNVKGMKYLTSMVDIRFKTGYVYVDVGARGYGTSIGSWFKKVYPKQGKEFKVFAIEADRKFHEEYKAKKKVKLLPYAAWVRNESLFFEIKRAPNSYDVEKGIRGMGRVQSAHTSSKFMGDMNKIQGFDFAEWVKSSFSERDFVVVKMDVEGSEFDLVAKMVETGAICLVDEMFLECHYDRRRDGCCDGERGAKYQRGYKECLELYASLREKGVLVHQWW